MSNLTEYTPYIGIYSEYEKWKNSSAGRKWKKSIYERDNFKCVHCSSGKNIVAHHIKKFKIFKHLRIDILNGKTLCRKCHIKLHKCEKKNG